MAETPPWLSIIGFGEDGLSGLSEASRSALVSAEIVMGPERHMSLLPDGPQERVIWPVPFADGIAQLTALRGRKVAVLASGDPFWFGAGSVFARAFAPQEWQAFPQPSVFSLVANRLGWALEHVTCLGLHAAPLTRLRPALADGARVIVLLRDAAALDALRTILAEAGFGASQAWICSAMGGPRERIVEVKAHDIAADLGTHPVAVALSCVGEGLPLAPGLADDVFTHDGQITKAPIRAITLTALAPHPGEQLWDIGSGSGSIAIEWLRLHPSLRAISIEANATRAETIRANALKLGQDRLEIVEGRAPEALIDLPAPNAIFVGGGLSEELLQHLSQSCPGARIVANAVTLESEALLQRWHASRGGALMRVELSRAAPIGPRTGWKAAYPIVQWSAVL